jgi:hypothetical protein
MILVSFTAFQETYAPTILARRAAHLRKDTGDSRYYTEHERAMASRSVFSVLLQALTRPLRLLMFHPIVQINAVMSAFDYGKTLIYKLHSTHTLISYPHVYRYPIYCSC